MEVHSQSLTLRATASTPGGAWAIETEAERLEEKRMLKLEDVDRLVGGGMGAWVVPRRLWRRWTASGQRVQREVWEGPVWAHPRWLTWFSQHMVRILIRDDGEVGKWYMVLLGLHGQRVLV